MASGSDTNTVTTLIVNGDMLRLSVSCKLAFREEIVKIYSAIASPILSLKDCLLMAIEKLSLDQGMPPSTDPHVMKNIVEPAVGRIPRLDDKPISAERFIEEFEKVAELLVRNLKRHPVTVCHSRVSINGRMLRKMLNSRAELNNALNRALRSLPKDQHDKISKLHLYYALRDIATSEGDLPRTGGLERAVNAAFSTMIEGTRMVPVDEFKKELIELLLRLALQLYEHPIVIFELLLVRKPPGDSSSPSKAPN